MDAAVQSRMNMKLAFMNLGSCMAAHATPTKDSQKVITPKERAKLLKGGA